MRQSTSVLNLGQKTVYVHGNGLSRDFLRELVWSNFFVRNHAQLVRVCVHRLVDLANDEVSLAEALYNNRIEKNFKLQGLGQIILGVIAMSCP